MAISLGFLALFGAFIALGERALQEASDRLLEERLVIAQMAAAQIDFVLRESMSELERARRFADFDPTDENLGAELHVLAHTYGRVGRFESGVVFLDSQGRVVLAEPTELYATGSDLSEMAHISIALESEGPTVSYPFLSPASGQPVVAVTVPVYDGAQLLGLLSGHISLRGDAISEPLERSARLGRTGHAILVDDDGKALASSFNIPFLAPGEHTSFYRIALLREEPIVESVEIEFGSSSSEQEGAHHVMAFAPLEEASWGVAVGGNSEETFAGVRRLRNGLALLGVAALLGIWTATLMGTRRMVKPVQRLTSAAERIADRKLETPLEIREGGEIGAMAEALERMRQMLLVNIEQLADWNESLEVRVAERTEELRRHQNMVQRLLRRTINAHEEERARLARELHDDIGQMLTAVQLSLDQLANSLPDLKERHQEQLSQTRELTDATMADLRRIIAAVRPGILGELGLLPALEWVADRSLRPHGIAFEVSGSVRQGRLSNEIQILLFRIAQEAINNVARHSDASKLRISVAEENGTIHMEFSDDGKGFDPQEVSAEREFEGGLGLAGMAERAALAGGDVQIESTSSVGTRISVTVPLPADDRIEND